jgi:hypothetical protein
MLTSLLKNRETGNWERSGEHSLSVASSSASLQVPGEFVIPVDANHTDIVKFSSPSNPTYILVHSYIKQCIPSVPSTQKISLQQTQEPKDSKGEKASVDLKAAASNSRNQDNGAAGYYESSSSISSQYHGGGYPPVGVAPASAYSMQSYPHVGAYTGYENGPTSAYSIYESPTTVPYSQYSSSSSIPYSQYDSPTPVSYSQYDSPNPVPYSQYESPISFPYTGTGTVHADGSPYPTYEPPAIVQPESVSPSAAPRPRKKTGHKSRSTGRGTPTAGGDATKSPESPPQSNHGGLAVGVKQIDMGSPELDTEKVSSFLLIR